MLFQSVNYFLIRIILRVFRKKICNVSTQNIAGKINKITRMKEPDLIQDSVPHAIYSEVDFGANFKKLRITDNVRELQTVLRDKYARGSVPPFYACCLFNVDEIGDDLYVSAGDIYYIDLNKMSNF